MLTILSTMPTRVAEQPAFHRTHRFRAIISFLVVSLVAVFSTVRETREAVYHPAQELLTRITTTQQHTSSRVLRGLNEARVIVGFDVSIHNGIRESIPPVYLPYLRQQYPHLGAALFRIPISDTVPSVDILLNEFRQLPAVV
jgi:hypothetical protein